MILIQVLKPLLHFDGSLLPRRMLEFNFFENVPNLFLAVLFQRFQSLAEFTPSLVETGNPQATQFVESLLVFAGLCSEQNVADCIEFSFIRNGFGGRIFICHNKTSITYGSYTNDTEFCFCER